VSPTNHDQSSLPTELTSFGDDLTTFIAEEVSTGDEPVLPDTDLLMSGLIDSLGVVLIVEWIQERLGIEVNPADVVFEHFASVSAMIDYLRSRDDVAVG
jgi:acyl carrier protein